MPKLVPIPWQPSLYLTPHTLTYLVLASRYYGSNLYVASPDGAWRSFARQLVYWLRWLRYRLIPASSPVNGPRFHMRGAAFDLVLTTDRVQRACRRAGLIRDPAEEWHWNDPNWASMPIIRTRLSLSSLTVSLLTQAQESTMNCVRSKTKPENYYLFDSMRGWRTCSQDEAGAINAMLGRKRAPVLDPDDIHLLQAIYGPWKS